MDAFEEFQADSFVSRLLGKGDVKGLAKKLEEAMPEAKQQELMEQMQKGNMTLRTFRSFLEQVGSMGSLSSVCLKLCLTLYGHSVLRGAVGQQHMPPRPDRRLSGVAACWWLCSFYTSTISIVQYLSGMSCKDDPGDPVIPS
jgi:hypothetical protein